jgi:phosphohistidine swiveling domain-containing protein
MSKYIKWLDDVGKSDIESVGGKAASLGYMLQARIPVPPGYVITIDAFRAGMTERLKKEIAEAFDRLGYERVAVRSSAVAEDAENASWAGQLDSYLNIKESGLFQAVEMCWRSIKSQRAKEYASENNISEAGRAVGVVVQAMVDSEVSGVMFTANPVTQSDNELLIEAIYGLGELLVQGTVTPETLIVNKSSGKPISRETTKQRKMLTYKNNVNKEVSVPAKKLKKEVLDSSDIKRLAKMAKQIETHCKNVPQDIEWAMSKGKLYAVQSRPITTLRDKKSLPEFFNHCIKTIARPATLQRDEIVRYTSNAVHPVEVVTVPLEGTTRAYYLEAKNAKRILDKCVADTDSEEKLTQHLKDYDTLKRSAANLKKLIEANPRNYQAIFQKYFNFLDILSSFLYVGVAVDKIIYPQFKNSVEERYPNDAKLILEIVATPKDLHDYQKLRLAICELIPKYKGNSKKYAAEIANIVKAYRHVNEYSFVEHLTDAKYIKQELSRLSLEQAKDETNRILGAVEQNPRYKGQLSRLIPNKTLFAQALLIKEYAFLRTDRIDRLKLVQATLRKTFEEIARDLRKASGKKWQRAHIANLLYREVFDYLQYKKIPKFEEIEKRIGQKYLYYYSNNTTKITMDSGIIARAHSIIVQPEESQEGSLVSPGTTAFRGIAEGKVVKISSPADLKRVRPGDIMIARVTMPDYTSVMKKAAGFITAEGGITSHAAIVARELSKPCIVGSDNCMEVLQDGDFVVLDSVNQIVQYTRKP